MICIVTSPPVGELTVAMSRSVCLLVSVSLCLSASISPELHVKSSRNFRACYHLRPWFAPPLAALSHGLRCVLPVLWMTSYLHVMGHMKTCGYRCSEWRHCVVVSRMTPCWVVFAVSCSRRVHHARGAGAEPAMHRCIVWFLARIAASGLHCFVRCSVRGLFVCMLVTTVSTTKTAKPIEMPFRRKLAWVQGIT